MAASGAGGGAGGVAGVAGGSGGGGLDAGAAATDAGGGAVGDAGSSGAGGEPCVFPVPVSYPPHCFNKAAGDGETGVDCGGSECAPCSTNQPCSKASDCSSDQCASNNTCTALISLSYTPIEVGAKTRTPKFTLNITYSDTHTMPLNQLTIRYYYNHNQVTEPVIGLDSQATIDPGNMQLDISTKVLASVHRFPPGPPDPNNFVTDSYLEIGFNDTTTVTTGTKFVITQDIVAGSPDELFDQNSHYSFSKTTGANQAVTVYRGGKRVWGVEPPMALFPDCAFARGANINGPALTVDGESLLTESDAKLTINGGSAYTSTSKLLPTPGPTSAVPALLGTGRTLSTADSAAWAVPNGKYWAYAWLASTVPNDSGRLSFGTGVTGVADKFFGSTGGGARWALIGPYSVTVTGNSLPIIVDGTVHLAGVKLYEAEAEH